MKTLLSELEYATDPPRVCPKPDCGGTFFIPHEDGWQCWNCMKIIYRNQASLPQILNSQVSDTPVTSSYP
jgi:ribosomal protein S27AE